MGPYFMESWVPIGSLFLSMEVPISLGNSVNCDKPGTCWISLKRLNISVQVNKALPRVEQELETLIADWERLHQVSYSRLAFEC